MDMLDIKNNFHHLIESIDDEAVLLNFYLLMKTQLSENDTLLIDTLSAKQYKVLMEVFDERFNDDNLMANEAIKQKYNKWFTK